MTYDQLTSVGNVVSFDAAKRHDDDGDENECRLHFVGVSCRTDGVKR